MKKILLVMTFISVIMLMGCGNQKNNEEIGTSSIQQQEVGFDASNYEGQWKSSEEGFEARYVSVKAVDSDMINFEYMMVSSAPYYRVASIDVEDVILDKDGIGKFEFEEDGWNHKGTGTIRLSEEGVEIKIETIENNEEATGESLWEISSGKYNTKLEE